MAGRRRLGADGTSPGTDHRCATGALPFCHLPDSGVAGARGARVALCAVEPGQGGRVLVELIFTSSARAPAVRVVENEGDETLVTAVKGHVSIFRLPCLLDSEAAVRLRQSYVFEPDRRDGVRTAPSDMTDADRQPQLKCMVANDGSRSPSYPIEARRGSVEGNLLVKLRLTAPDKAHEVTAHGAALQRRNLASTVEEWTKKLRMPGLEGPRVEAVMVFMFRLEGSPPSGLRDRGFLKLAAQRERPGPAGRALRHQHDGLPLRGGPVLPPALRPHPGGPT